MKENNANNVLLSVITPCYNSSKTIVDTIESLLNQGEHWLECIFIDGGSTDCTVSLIESYRSQYEIKGINLTVISENDEGIYDAINKGINLASGYWVSILNSDDFYDKGALDEIFCFLRKSNSDIIYANMRIIKEGRKIDGVLKPKGIDRIKKEMSIFHPSSVVKRQYYIKYGLYDINYKYSADYKFFLFAYNNKASFEYLDLCLACYDVGGATGENIYASWRELREIQIESGNSYFSSWYNYFSLCLKRKILFLFNRL